MVLLIDNYDSFTYNLYQYIGEIRTDITVYRNDQLTLEAIENLKPDCIIISPGPGRPEQAGLIIAIIKKFNGVIPILGICLGHQAIGLAMGGHIDLAPDVVHGKQSVVITDQKGIFNNIPKKFKVVRYHSLCLRHENLPDCLEVQAYTTDGIIMGIRHKVFLTVGVQFHPESILSEYGKELLKNFFDRVNVETLDNSKC
ncbi:anthranilate synthase component II [Cellulosilyticum sp. I15G10I2]|uniref:anthranilate synthase component II n=1 Tax=Cellulosilyticum sp. I15G10I2 TaxID=1892843 RepID=UPI00085CBD42|nr:aminodeoxychorismate/anthranilate synthase component II [Cellulosilyticum sp. I15G10I2]